MGWFAALVAGPPALMSSLMAYSSCWSVAPASAVLDERSKDANSTNDTVRVLLPDDNIILPVLLDGSLLNVLCAMTSSDVSVSRKL